MPSVSQRNMERLILTTVLSLTLGSAASSGPSSPPVVIAVLHKSAVLPCGSSTFVCEECGAPQWTFVSTDAVVTVLQTIRFNRFRLLEDGSLKIYSVRNKDAGLYHCAPTHGGTHTVSLSVVSAFPYGDESCSLVSPEKDRFSLRSELKPHQRRGFLLVPQTFYQKKRLHCTVLDQLTGDQKVFKVPQDGVKYFLDLYLTSSAAAVVTTVTVTVRPTIFPEETRETPLSSIRLRVVAGLVAAVGPALVILALVKVWCRCRKGTDFTEQAVRLCLNCFDVSHMFQANNAEQKVVYSSVIKTRAS